MQYDKDVTKKEMLGVLFTQYSPRITAPLSFRDVYVELFCLADDTGKVVIDRDKIAETLGINPGVVSNNLTRYLQAGFIKKIESKVYQIVLFKEILQIQDIKLTIKTKDESI